MFAASPTSAWTTPIGPAEWTLDLSRCTHPCGKVDYMPDNTAPIVVGVNGSFVAVRAALWAAAVGSRLNVPLHILTATPYLGHNPSDATAAIRAAAIGEHREVAEQILKAAEEAVRREYPALVVTTASADEPADEALSAASRTARLLVLGCDDVTAAGAVLVGSTTLGIVAHAECPVVAWRGDATTPTGEPIVVGVAGSAGDRRALGTAFELAESLGAPLRAIHSWSRSRPAADVTIPFLIDWDELENEQWRHLNEQVRPWRDRYPGVKVTLVCGPAKPSRTLLEQATDAQLVVVGSRRRNALTRGLFGSTSLNLLHHSKVTVVLCPFTEDE
jgi:nucleotide-binding universal stress UspA family protein